MAPQKQNDGSQKTEPPTSVLAVVNAATSAVPLLAAVNAALDLVRVALPVIEQLRLAGVISVEQQREVRKNYQSLVTRADGQFSGPEWQIDD